jgi:hypothetical protein
MDNEPDQLEQQQFEQALAKRTLKVFTELYDIMPPIGFISRNKRVSAYLTVTSHAQKIIDSEQITEGEILFLLSMMVRKKKDFQKAAMMTVLSLPKMDISLLSTVGFKFANDIRVNMQLTPVSKETSLEI